MHVSSPAVSDSELCVLNESCILPCRFTTGDDTVIHWMQEETRVHSYYHNEDQLTLQNQRFKGRTSLFKDQISRGNASLQLTGVEVQDQGIYKCYTSTITSNRELFIDLHVEGMKLDKKNNKYKKLTSFSERASLPYDTEGLGLVLNFRGSQNSIPTSV